MAGRRAQAVTPGASLRPDHPKPEEVLVDRPYNGGVGDGDAAGGSVTAFRDGGAARPDGGSGQKLGDDPLGHGQERILDDVGHIRGMPPREPEFQMVCGTDPRLGLGGGNRSCAAH